MPIEPALAPHLPTPHLCVHTTQVTPWSKSGGLADVCSSLPIALAERGHRVMVVSPRYKPYDKAVDTGVGVGGGRGALATYPGIEWECGRGCVEWCCRYKPYDKAVDTGVRVEGSFGRSVERVG